MPLTFTVVVQIAAQRLREKNDSVERLHSRVRVLEGQLREYKAEVEKVLHLGLGEQGLGLGTQGQG